MKKIYLIIAFISVISSCKQTSKKLIAGRWNVADMYTEDGRPSHERFSTDAERNTLFYSNRFIFREDGTFDINLLQAYMHGKWEYKERDRLLFLKLDNGLQSFECHIDSMSLFAMIITPDKKFFHHVTRFSDTALVNNTGIDLPTAHTILLSFNKETYYKEEKDPYNIANNQWRVQPLHRETDKEVRARALNHLHFLQLIFKDALDKDRDAVVYNWFNTPFTLASNGVALKFYHEIKPTWERNFYDSTEAKEGYELLRKCFSKKIKFMQTDNKFLKKVDMLDQMMNNMNNN